MLDRGLRAFELIEEIVQNREADFVSLSRPLIKEHSVIYE